MKIKILLISLFSFCHTLFAQEGLPLYQDYLTSSWYLIHPSMAGAASANQVRLTARNQWLDVEDAPTLFTASVNGRVSKKVGLGLVAFSDTNGNFSESAFYGTFAYHLNLSPRETQLKQISFGISFGMLQNKIDETGFGQGAIAGDPVIFGGVLSDSYFNVDFGISYLVDEFFAHASLRNALPISKDQFITIDDNEPDNQRKIVFTTGYNFKLTDGDYGVSLEPSFQYLSTPSLAEQLIDVNGKVYKQIGNKNTLWGGASYRRALGNESQFIENGVTLFTEYFETVSGFIGIDYSQLVFGYTYTQQVNQSTIGNSGFHQITLGYNFGSDSKSRSGSKRWDCNCPAANY